MSSAPRILALGGHEFDRRHGNDAICDLIVELADSPRPRICLLPTASGDPEDQITRFRRAFGDRDCIPSVVSLFRLGARPVDLRSELLTQEVIYVGGGSLVNLIAIWRAHGVDRLLAECWRRGILLCGQSAGGMCWFEGGITSSSGKLTASEGLGLLPSSACVHYLTEPMRRRLFLRSVAAGELPPGLGLEDQTGALFEGTELVETVSARPGASVWRAEAGNGGAEDVPLDSRRLVPAPASSEEPTADILELRRTLAVRDRRGRLRRG